MNKSYVAPFDMFGGQVKKGDVYVRSQSIEPYYAFEAKPGVLCFHLPAEIVETWESYKSEEEIWKEIWIKANVSQSDFLKEVEYKFTIKQK
jgi:hypothetical protein